MMWKARIRRLFVGGLLSLLVFVSIAFSGKRHGDRMINDLIIHVDNQYDNYFVDQEDVKSLINQEDATYLLTTDIGELDLKLIEKRVQRNKFVDDVQAFLDHHGNLIIEIQQSKPIARIFDPNGPDFYVDTRGRILPTSDKYTARVLLLDFEQKSKYLTGDLNNTPHGRALYEVLQFIDQDEFWKSQIAQLSIDKNDEITVTPQVTKQSVVFGLAENIEDKFKRLAIFYKKILPVKGWNTYQTVNLKYANQIVCE